MAVETLDTTLRDGAQAAGLSFSVGDKLDIIALLDSFGIDLIECGNPYSNPKDRQLFKAAAKLSLGHARICAFGQTRKKGCKAQDDENLLAMLDSQAPVVSLVGKASRLHVAAVLQATMEENLSMIHSSVSFLTQEGRSVYFDAEHFFDSYKSDAHYAMACIEAALEAGAEKAVLCDTNGAALPGYAESVVREASRAFPGKIGVHFHDDRAMAAANTVMSALAGASHIQGTFNGFGERCGNASLSTALPILMEEAPNLCPPVKMKDLTRTARAIAKIADAPLPATAPFVGENAFSHKGGLHVDAMQKLKGSYEHVDPKSVGNKHRYLLSDASGRGAASEICIRLFGERGGKQGPYTAKLLETVKAKEADGYQYEDAEASLELLALQAIGRLNPPYAVELYRVIGEKAIGSKNNVASAIVKIRVGDKSEIAAAEGNGPVHALDAALRRALESFFPSLKDLYLSDYRVRVINPESASAAKVRVVIKSDTHSGIGSFSTVGVSTDVVDASFKALLDSFAFHLFRNEKGGENHEMDAASG
ncbi:MAG: citramalate synthase [Eubacteriaceae bacterium]|jgi:2-isopropylmalate synthase|nr:citramalate synthase [Eubacteriaceae bacterium]